MNKYNRDGIKLDRMFEAGLLSKYHTKFLPNSMRVDYQTPRHSVRKVYSWQGKLMYTNRVSVHG